jgi:hypothetical protein
MTKKLYLNESVRILTGLPNYHYFFLTSSLFFYLGTCDGGIFTYEKTTGHFLRTAQQEPLVLETQAPGITLECSNMCSGLGSDCPSFSVDYGGQRCFKMDRYVQGVP